MHAPPVAPRLCESLTVEPPFVSFPVEAIKFHRDDIKCQMNYQIVIGFVVILPR